MKKYFMLMRVKHYVKNILIFLPLIFSGNLFSCDLLLKTCICFCTFCLLSSVIYIVNDIKDVEKDRNHPTKKKRPIASGVLSIKKASIIAIVCGAITVLISIFMFGWSGVLVELLYFILNVLYSIKFKDIPIVDIAILVSGFFLRVLFGSVITGIEISPWLFLTVIAVSFYLGLGKRRNEIEVQNSVNGGEETRPVLSFYNYAFLDKNMYMCMALTNVFYALWAAGHPTSGMLWTVPLVIIMLMRYSLIVEGDSDGDPIEVILHDRFLLVLAVLYAMAVLIMMYII